MRRPQGWKLLIVGFVVFWLFFAVVLFLANIPFFVISIALTTIGMLSVLVVALAWAYTHDF